MRSAAIVLSVCFGWLAWLAPGAEAVILYGDSGTAASGRNLGAPTGNLADSGWAFTGNWQNGAGTAIAPNLFLTATHLGGNVGDIFRFQGQSYTTVASYFDPGGSDLRILEVAGSFSQYASIYTKADETSHQMVVYGAGTARGAAIDGPNGPQGYLWGGTDLKLSWGTNQVSGVEQFGGTDLLTFQFGATPPPGSAASSTLSRGDSGGGLFIQDTADGQWKLAGVNYAVDGRYSTDGSTFFDAAMYDQRGFYIGLQSNNSFVGNVGLPLPQLAYSTRVSSHQAFIQQTIALAAVPEPSSVALIAVGLGAMAVRRLRRRA